MDFAIANRHDELVSPEAPAMRLLEALAGSQTYKLPVGGELSLVFVGDSEIARVHGDFMDDPSPTDVITFPAEAEMGFAGEIIVSVDHARDRAADLGESFSDELTLYIVHGWLHLLGYDDRKEGDRAEMRRAETRALRYLRDNGIVADFELAGA